MTNPRALLDYALAYYDQGLCVIPAIYGEKKPAVEWKRYQKERPSREQVVKWFQDQDGKRNIAIVCGEVSGNLTVIDFDDPSVYPRFFDTAKVEAATPVVKTARGVQVYLRSGKPVETFKLPELHVEVRGNGSLVIAPPSLHPSGSHYEFKNRLTEIQMVAALEEAVWRRVEELGVRRRIYVDPSWRFQGTGAYRGPDPPCITWLLKGVVKGLRHDAAIRLLSYWINFRHERPKAALDKAKDWNRRNEEPLPEQELADIYKDVVKEPYNYGCTDTLYRCGCNPANCEIGKHKPSEEALTKAEAFMKDPVGFIQYLQQCLEYRLTGEQKNRLFIFLVAAGAGVQTSVIRITGPNSVGKNQLIRWLQEFFGADRVIAISSATVNWLKRKVMRGLDTRGKIFILLEERGEREGAFKYQFEQIYSEDKVIIGLNVRDKETGEWEPVEVELQGPLCFITTSTELETSLHAKTREWEVYPDDSEAQTRRIDAWINWRELLPLKRLEEEKQEIAVVKAYLSLLKPHRDYRLPFIDRIDFKSRTLEDRRKKNDFINLMKYACHVFQGSLPIDSETDTVFALPFIFSFVMTIADEIIFTSRGGLTRNEKRILDYLQEHPEIYKVTAEGKVPKKRIRQGTLGQEELDYDEKPIGVRASDLIETGEFEDIHENTVKNALSGLARKRYLLVLKDSGRGTPKVYGKPLRSNLVVNSESQQKALLPEMRPFPVDFLSSQVHKILYGEVPQPSERQTRNRGLIETCQLVNFEISPETALFQPKWALSELFK